MYSFQSRIRYSEVNPDKVLPVSSIVDYFQDCSTFQSEDYGIGFDYLKSINRVWLLCSWQVEIKRQPGLGEKITIGTWPYSFKSMFGYRNFIMLGEHEEVCAVANSIWLYYDFAANRPAKVLPENISGYTIEPPYDMTYLDRKLYYPEDIVKREAFPVKPGHLDTNNHVNNCQYIKMAEDYLPENAKIKQLRVDYRKAALYGDTIISHTCQKDNQFFVVLTDADKNPYVITEFTLDSEN